MCVCVCVFQMKIFSHCLPSPWNIVSTTEHVLSKWDAHCIFGVIWGTSQGLTSANISWKVQGWRLSILRMNILQDAQNVNHHPQDFLAMFPLCESGLMSFPAMR